MFSSSLSHLDGFNPDVGLDGSAILVLPTDEEFQDHGSTAGEDIAEAGNPTTPKGAPMMSAISGTLGAAFNASRFPAALREAICVAMGCDEQEDAEIVGSLPQPEIDSLLEDMSVDGRPPSRIEKAKVAHLFKNLEKKVDPPIAAIPKANTPQPIVVNITNNDDKLV